MKNVSEGLIVLGFSKDFLLKTTAIENMVISVGLEISLKISTGHLLNYIIKTVGSVPTVKGWCVKIHDI